MNREMKVSCTLRVPGIDKNPLRAIGTKSEITAVIRSMFKYFPVVEAMWSTDMYPVKYHRPTK
jgi:hypothetical protein